jgi:hypothetical protein
MSAHTSCFFSGRKLPPVRCQVPSKASSALTASMLRGQGGSGGCGWIVLRGEDEWMIVQRGAQVHQAA